MDHRQGDGGIGLFSGPYNTGRGLPQVLFLGPEGAGKTTLFYSTVVPGWSSTIATEMTPTPTFHYEVVMRGNVRFGMWEVSGSSTMQALWPLYYRHMAFDALVFVVSVLDPQLSVAKGWIRRLVNEDELRSSLIIVVINSFDQETEELEQKLNGVAAALGLEETIRFLDNPDRLRWFVVNAKEGERDESWHKVIGWMTSVMYERHHGGPGNALPSRYPPERPRVKGLSPTDPQRQPLPTTSDATPR